MIATKKLKTASSKSLNQRNVDKKNQLKMV